MKRGGILNPSLSHLLASTGHTDYFTVCDRGFPVPPGPERIDLALVDDIPTVLDVLGAVLAEWSLDRVLITHEMDAISPDRVAEMRALLEKLIVDGRSTPGPVQKNDVRVRRYPLAAAAEPKAKVKAKKAK